MNTEMIQAARAAFKQNPETACKALLGCTPEELFCEAVKAARGCNQHAHKPGCPDANGASADFISLEKQYSEKAEAEKEKEKKLMSDLRNYERQPRFISGVNEAIDKTRAALVDNGRKKHRYNKLSKIFKLFDIVGKANPKDGKVKAYFIDSEWNEINDESKARGVIISRDTTGDRGKPDIKSGAYPLWKMIKESGLNISPDTTIDFAVGQDPKAAGPAPSKLFWDKGKVSIRFNI
jgi:hypothetical protein